MNPVQILPDLLLISIFRGFIKMLSDQLVRQEFTTSEERQTGFTQMMQLALETAIKLEK